MEDLEKVRKENNALPEKGPEVEDSPITNFGTRGWSEDKILEYTKEIQNLFNLIADRKEDGSIDTADKYAKGFISRLLKSKGTGKSFGEAVTSEDRKAISKRLGNNVKKVQEVLNKMKSTYNHEDFGEAVAQYNMLTSKQNRRNADAARAMERLRETSNNDMTPNEEGQKSTFTNPDRHESSVSKVLRKEGVTELDRNLGGATKQAAAIRNAASRFGSLSEEDRKKVMEFINAAGNAKNSVEDWKKILSAPGVRIKNYATPETIKADLLTFTLFNDDNPNGTVYNLLPADRKNMLEAYQQLGTKLPIETLYTNRHNKSMDVGDEMNSSKAELITKRFNQMWATGNPDYVYADPQIKKFVDTVVLDNGTVLKTETDRDRNEPGSNLRTMDNYINHLAKIIKNGSPEQLDEYLNDKPLTASKISADPDMVRDELNPVYDEDQFIRNNFGAESANKARKLYKDLMDMQNTLSPGTSINKDVFTPGVLRSLNNKFKALREKNPDMPYIGDILKTGDISDVFRSVHPKADRLKVILGDLLTNDYINKNREPIDWQGFSAAVNSNINNIKQAIESGDVSSLGKNMTKEKAEELLKYLDAAKAYTLTNNDIAEQAGFGKKGDVSELQSLADQAPEELAKAEEAVSVALDNLAEAEAKNKAEGDAEGVEYARKALEDAKSKVAYLKNTKVDILKRAEETGKSYQEVLEDYVHPDWEEDDIETYLDKAIAKYDLTDKLKAEYGDAMLGNSAQKSGAVADILDKFTDAYPNLGLSGWRDRLANWSRPLTPTELYGRKSSYNLAKSVIPELTPDVWSAMVNNRQFFESDNADKRRNMTYTGMSKTQAGAANTMEDAKNKLAKELQMADYTNDKNFASKKAEELMQNMADAGINETQEDKVLKRLAAASEALKNITKGVRLDVPGANDEE